MKSIVIIDDEPMARVILSEIIKKYLPEYKIIGEANSVKESIKLLNSVTPDLVLLDIQLSDGNGFDILKQIKDLTSKIIFTTSFDNYALRAIKFSASDYILKPINPNELVQSIKKTFEDKNKSMNSNQWRSFLKELPEKNNAINKIALSTHKGIELISINEIIRCQGDNSYTTFYISNGNKVVISKTLGYYEKLLNSQGFFRIHISHLINLNFIKLYIRGRGGEVVLKDNTILPVSRYKKDEFMKVLDKLT